MFVTKFLTQLMCCLFTKMMDLTLPVHSKISIEKLIVLYVHFMLLIFLSNVFSLSYIVSPFMVVPVAYGIRYNVLLSLPGPYLKHLILFETLVN